jgi:hypothetical protein
LSVPDGLAADGEGNVYIADYIQHAIWKWTAANSNVAVLVSSGVPDPWDVAVDAAGNVYIAGTSILKWTAANSNLTTLVSSGVSNPYGVAVDGSGNFYIANHGDGTVEKWVAATGNTITLFSGSSEPDGVAVDGTGNVYFSDDVGSAIKELPYAFVDPTAKVEGLAAGTDSLPVVLPAMENLLPPFAPTSDQSWLTIGGITNGVVSFSFTADTSGSSRTAHITLLGQSIPITQGTIGTPPILAGVQLLGNGAVQFTFTNNPNATFTVISSTNVTLPLSEWTAVGPATNNPPGQFQFTTPPLTNTPQRFYSVRSP